MAKEMRIQETQELAGQELRRMRAMLQAAFEGELSEDDWEHALGGTHVWIPGAAGELPICHAAIVERTLECGDIALAVGYVEAVATRADHRHAGHGTRVMDCVNEWIRGAHPLGALSTGASGFYTRLGWERWRGASYVDAPGGRQATPRDDGSILVLRTPRSPVLDLDAPITCDWRSGDVW